MRKWEVWCEYWDISGIKPEVVTKWSKVFTDWEEADECYRDRLNNTSELTGVYIDEIE